MILILREEIVCTIILAFLIFYYSINKVKDKEKPFLVVVSCALLHVIFDMITVITVNSRGTVPDMVNDICHVIFYITGILVMIGYFNYVNSVVGLNWFAGKSKIIIYVPLVVFIIAMMFVPMEYLEGNGTNYSYGILAFVGYGFFVIYCITCLAILIIMRHSLEKRVKRALFPLTIVMLVDVAVQAIVPELLMTGGNITIICIGMFVALDNPDKDFMEQALWDFPTGLKNRNCYNRDIEKYIHRFSGKKRRGSHQIGFVVADLNFLKRTNDEYGHGAGDALISAAASVLRENLKAAENVYRIGGDEFAAVYLDVPEEKIKDDVGRVKLAADKVTDLAVPLKIAMGHAVGAADGDTEAIFKEADQLMYEDKGAMKRA